MQRIVSLSVALALCLAAGGALAGTPGADWLTPAQTRQALKAAGYSEITKLEADDGHWDGEGIKEGRRMKFGSSALSVLTESDLALER